MTMAHSSELHCEPCQHENVTKYASMCCTDCEGGFCDECFKNHKAEYSLKNKHDRYKIIERLNVTIQCADHSKPLEVYCPFHDSAACLVCVQLNHVGCIDLKAIDEAEKVAETELSDLKQTIDSLLDNIEKRIHNLQQNEIDLKEQEGVAKKLVAKKRAEINKHLDRLQNKLIKAIKSKSEKAVSNLSLMRDTLESKRMNILELKDKAQDIKEYSSELQVFLGIRNSIKTVAKEVNGIPQLSIAVQINPKFETFIEAVDSFGTINITEALVPYVDRPPIQPQSRHAFDNLQLTLRANFKIPRNDSFVTSCLILPNHCIMIVDHTKPSLIILKEDGSHDRDISVMHEPYDVTIIDDQRVAVSYINQSISIVNFTTHDTNKTLQNLCKLWIWGITYYEGKIYAVTEYEGIKIFDLDGNVIKTIRIYNKSKSSSKVIVLKDKIYYSVNNGSVHCVDMEGTEIWRCQDDRLLSNPSIAVDNYGVTFATGYGDNLLLAISPDGKQQKVLLTSSDGLQHPDALYYDKDKNRLLVCNRHKGHVGLYDVIY